MQAITGILQVFLFNMWLDRGVQHLSFDVTISCAALMLTCKIFVWRIGLLTSGKSLVQRKLQFLLLRKYMTMDEQALSAQVENRPGAVSLDDRFQEAITSTASQLSIDCYQPRSPACPLLFLGLHLRHRLPSLPRVRVELLSHGSPDYHRGDAVFVAPIWLAIVLLAISAFRAPKKAEPSTGHMRKRSFDEWFSTGTILTGILWITTYVSCPPASPRRATASARTVALCSQLLWACGPLLVNPLKNDFRRLRHISISGLLTPRH